MIKVQIHEPFKDRNEPTFRMMMACKDYFKQIGIEFTNSNDFDYLFIGMNDFIANDEDDYLRKESVFRF